MELTHVTYRGPELDDASILEGLPDNLAELLRSLNGFIQYGGGLHFRGACSEPAWHSLHTVREGELALHCLYAEVDPEDVPFAQDCVGDQFLLRDRKVLRLLAETGEVQAQANELGSFLEAASADPIGYLQMQPLLRLREEGRDLEPGQLIYVYPPFCTREAANGVSLRAVPAHELIQVHAQLAAQLPADGEQVRIEVTDS